MNTNRLHKIKPRVALGVALGTLLGLAGCADDEAPYTPVDTTPPTVNSVDPPPGTKNVGLQGPIRVTFSEAMSTSSYSPGTVSAGPAGPVPAPRVASAPQETIPLEYLSSENGDTLTIVPDSLFFPEREWAITIEGVTDLAGNAVETFTTTFETGPFEPEFLDDRMEPNDDLTLRSYLEADAQYPALSTCRDDQDFFAITLMDTFMLTARTTIKRADRDAWEIAWTRRDGSLYASKLATVSSGDVAAHHHTFLPGFYYLWIHSPGDEELVLYDLVVEPSDPCTDDAYEDNDFQDAAHELDHDGLYTDLIGCYRDADWFMIEVLEGHGITIEADLQGYLGTRRLEIREPGGRSAVLETDGESSSQLDLEVTENGTAYFMVKTWADQVAYHLAVALDR